MLTLQTRILHLADRLTREALEDISLAHNGTPVTSMAEDFAIGEQGKLKRRIAKELRAIVGAK